jgi:membrane-anchored protein YejM (alkaline phosphatase superfamily)
MFWQYQCELAALWDLKSRSLYFRKCQATGTSTLFALCSVSQGSVECMDCNDCNRIYSFWENIAIKKDRDLFEILRDDHGYEIMASLFSDYGFPDVLEYHRYFLGIPQCLEFKEINQKSNFPGDFFQNARLSSRSFAVYLHDIYDIDHTSAGFENPAEVGVVDDLSESFRNRLRRADTVVKMALANLEELDLLRETLVVVFGDHGHPGFSREFNSRNEGVGILTDAASSWVPLFLYNSGMGVGVSDALACRVGGEVSLPRPSPDPD